MQTTLTSVTSECHAAVHPLLQYDYMKQTDKTCYQRYHNWKPHILKLLRAMQLQSFIKLIHVLEINDISFKIMLKEENGCKKEAKMTLHGEEG